MSSRETDVTKEINTQRSARISADRLWDEALGFLQAELPRSSFDTWVRDTEPLYFDGQTFTIGVANPYTRQWLEENILDNIHRTLALIIGYAVDVQIVDDVQKAQELLQSAKSKTIENVKSPDPGQVLIPPSDTDEKFEFLLRFRRYWEEIVDPEKVVSISRYFVKYWLPILGPNFSSIVLAFKQIRYLHQIHSDRAFEVKGSEILRWLCVDETTFYRHLNQPHPLLSWFVEKAPSIGKKYERSDQGRVRRKPRNYIVYGGVPLIPPHQALVKQVLERFGASTSLTNTLHALEEAIKISDSELEEMLDQSFDEYRKNGEKDHPEKACTVLDIVREMLKNGDANLPIERIAALAEEVENHLVRPDRAVLLTWYFIQEWQPLLSSSAFWLIVLLRSRGFYDRRSTELRDVFWVNGGYAELGSLLGVSSETISGWLGQNRKKSETSLSSYMKLFIRELERSRGQDPQNGRFLSVKLRVEMLDPLNPEGEKRFMDMVRKDEIFQTGMTHPEEDHPEKIQIGGSDYPENYRFGEGESTEMGQFDSPGSSENRMLGSEVLTEFSMFGTRDSTEKSQLLKDSPNTESVSKRTPLSENTLINTTTQEVNQLILPLIYYHKSDAESERGCCLANWNLQELLHANNLPTEQVRALQRVGISGQDFAAWILYAYSQEGRGIEKPGFFAAKRLLESPPILAQERWRLLAEKGPEFIRDNIRRGLDPMGEDIDKEWGGVMGKVSRERLEQLVRDLGL